MRTDASKVVGRVGTGGGLGTVGATMTGAGSSRGTGGGLITPFGAGTLSCGDAPLSFGFAMAVGCVLGDEVLEGGRRLLGGGVRYGPFGA